MSLGLFERGGGRLPARHGAHRLGQHAARGVPAGHGRFGLGSPFLPGCRFQILDSAEVHVACYQLQITLKCNGRDPNVVLG